MDIPIELVIMGVLMTAVALFGVYTYFNNRMVSQLGLELEVDEGPFGRNKPVIFRVKFQPTKDLKVRSVTACLLGLEPTRTEEYRIQQLARSTTFEEKVLNRLEELWQQEFTLAENLKLKAGKSTVLEGKVEAKTELEDLNIDASEASNISRCSPLHWMLRLTVKAQGGPPALAYRQIELPEL